MFSFSCNFPFSQKNEFKFTLFGTYLESSDFYLYKTKSCITSEGTNTTGKPSCTTNGEAFVALCLLRQAKSWWKSISLISITFLWRKHVLHFWIYEKIISSHSNTFLWSVFEINTNEMVFFANFFRQNYCLTEIQSVLKVSYVFLTQFKINK